jgi:hypothetical protein
LSIPSVTFIPRFVFCVAGLSPKTVFPHRHPAIAMGARVPRIGAQSRSGRHARSTRCRGTDMLGCSYSLEALARFSQAPPDAPATLSRTITVNSLRDNYLRVSRQKLVSGDSVTDLSRRAQFAYGLTCPIKSAGQEAHGTSLHRTWWRAALGGKAGQEARVTYSAARGFDPRAGRDGRRA